MLRAISILWCATACGDPVAAPADAGGSDAGRDAGSDAGEDAAAESSLDRAVAILASGTSDEIDALVREVAWSDRWPLSDGDRFLFVTRSSGTPALAGDFNAWDTTRDVATRAAGGAHAYAIVTIAEPAGAKYKWFEGGAYVAPAEATAYGFDDFGEHGFVRPPSTGGHLERFPDLVSEAMPIPRALRFWIPAALDPARARVILFHDGQNVFHPDAPFGGWQGRAALAEYPDAIAILVDNASDRFDAYTHVEDAIGAERDGGRADAYLDLIEDEVLPFARALRDRREQVVARRRGLLARWPRLDLRGARAPVARVLRDRDVADARLGIVRGRSEPRRARSPLRRTRHDRRLSRQRRRGDRELRRSRRRRRRRRRGRRRQLLRHHPVPRSARGARLLVRHRPRALARTGCAARRSRVGRATPARSRALRVDGLAAAVAGR
jgi:hypothetical protein